jgi:PAS domain S-box-containing protein
MSRRVAIIFNDITERKKADEALKESEEKYRNIVETANEGISIIDAEDRITYVNKKMEDMIGYSTEEIIGKSMWDFISVESKPLVKMIMDKERQSFNESFEIKLIRKGGSSIWMHTNAKSLYDNDGKFTGSLNMHTDITENKEAEERLRESEEKYRNIVETANEGISIINAEAKIDSVPKSSDERKIKNH